MPGYWTSDVIEVSSVSLCKRRKVGRRERRPEQFLNCGQVRTYGANSRESQQIISQQLRFDFSTLTIAFHHSRKVVKSFSILSHCSVLLFKPHNTSACILPCCLDLVSVVMVLLSSIVILHFPRRMCQDYCQYCALLLPSVFFSLAPEARYLYLSFLSVSLFVLGGASLTPNVVQRGRTMEKMIGPCPIVAIGQLDIFSVMDGFYTTFSIQGSLRVLYPFDQ